MLSIVVTHYKEDWNTSHFLFDSLAIQRGIDLNDVEIIVVNDGTETLGSFDYPYKVTEYTINHGGVSKARNYGLDHCKGEYVMFCDIDDMFLNSYGLHLIFETIEQKPDSIVCSFVEEQPKDDKWVLIQHDTKDSTFVHGKVYRTEFLRENNIRFDDELTIHEDGYFNCIALTLSKNKKVVPTPVYLWRWNENSVVRKDRKSFVLRTYPDLIKSRFSITKTLKEKGLPQEYLISIGKTIADAYYDFQLKEYRNEENKEYIEKARKWVRRYWEQYQKDFKTISGDMLGEILYLSRARAYQNGFRVEKETLVEFLKKV